MERGGRNAIETPRLGDLTDVWVMNRYETLAFVALVVVMVALATIW